MPLDRAKTMVSAVLAFVRARWLHARLNTEAKIRSYQARKLRKFLGGPATRVAVNKHMSSTSLGDWPIISKRDQNARFADYNCAGITDQQIQAAMAANINQIDRYTVGVSTGTSGNRGHYVISEKERFRWLGVILSRALPDFWRANYRVAVVLPSNSRLYDSANESKRLSLKFFPTSDGVENQIDPIVAFNPNVIVASPRLLRCLVDANVELDLKHLFSGAEILSSFDRDVIERHFSCTVREIYMATEGLMAVACAHGNMHLIEDHLAFEWEDVPDQPTLKKPIITDFSRSTQIMVRYRMNDLVELGDRDCPCGSRFQIIKTVVGRDDDTFRLTRSDQTIIHVTPDVLRNTVVAAHEHLTDFRVILTGANQIKLQVHADQKQLLASAETALLELFERLRTRVTLQCEATGFVDLDRKKLRRVYVARGES